MNSVSAEPNVRPIKVYWDQVVLVSLKMEVDLFNQTWGWVWWYWWKQRASRVVGFRAPLMAVVTVVVVVSGLGCFSRCTERASGNPRRSPASSTHYTWTPPVVSCSAPSWQWCPERQAGKKTVTLHPLSLVLRFKYKKNKKKVSFTPGQCHIHSNPGPHDQDI